MFQANYLPIAQGYDGQGPQYRLEPRSLATALQEAATPPRLSDQQLYKLMDSEVISLFLDFINCPDDPDGPQCWDKFKAQLLRVRQTSGNNKGEGSGVQRGVPRDWGAQKEALEKEIKELQAFLLFCDGVE